MPARRLSLAFLLTVAITLALGVCASSISAFAQARSFVNLHVFGASADGTVPIGGLIADKTGNLYGVTIGGGSADGGTIFELSPTISGGPWTETVLYNFISNSTTGYEPAGQLARDAAGNLYGTTSVGGDLGGGTVFELSPPSVSGGTWTYNVLYSFTHGSQHSLDGGFPYAGVILDAAGNLYGTTEYGGDCDGGTVFELSPPATQGGAWTEAVLHNFHYLCGTRYSLDGERPTAPLILATDGSLIGTTQLGGPPSQGQGTIFRLLPPPVGETKWTETLLYLFTGGNDGGWPLAALVSDRAGNVYGTTMFGGTGTACSSGPNCGVVFELARPTAKGHPWTQSVLYNFTGGDDGAHPISSLVFNAKGSLFATSSDHGVMTCGGGAGCGAIIELTPPATQGGAWTETTLHTFPGDPNQFGLASGMVIGKNGALFGSAQRLGQHDAGTLFKMIP
jgi:uncharacterized repeat protein (TIGR03803 family)